MKNQLIVLFFGVCLLSTTSYSPTSSAATGETNFAPLIVRLDPRLNQIRSYTNETEEVTVMAMDDLVARILSQRQLVPKTRSLLVAVSGIDGSGKGYVTRQIVARLARQSVATASINVDGWLNLPPKRFNPKMPAENFYTQAIRFGDLFAKLLLPLRDERSVNLIADFAEETAHTYRSHTYSFKNIDVVLVEGIFLFKREYRELFDLRVWVDCSFSTALARALQRNQEGLSPAATIRAYDTIYFPAQRIHLEKDQPRESADLIVDNDTYPYTASTPLKEIVTHQSLVL